MAEVKKEKYELEARKKQEEISLKDNELSAINAKLEETRRAYEVLQIQLKVNSKELTRVATNLNEEKARTSAVISDKFAKDIISAQSTAKGSTIVANSAQELKQSSVATSYYVIALTSESCEDVKNEIARVKSLVGQSFNQRFPDAQPYAPVGALCTLLVSGDKLPYKEASELKKQAVEAGFNKDTWLWQSTVPYFSEKI